MSRPRTTRNTAAKSDDDARAVEQLLRRHQELAHIRVRHRAPLITRESGPADDPGRVAANLWQLEMATPTGRWEPTPFRAAATSSSG
ncbi:hypothetical protein [Nannocystis punicea]|uniref:Uncharacterized protein n=1 Tax=Nannocystis punicea TaxID=2995304 RepID=A0ABY7H0Q7_9BACT|nr:hypothetical protein [Nannocystis poenicansa]WAS92836.1 hypothetical protein O0S08_42230 [Nannocystis poenicansa]